jgi:hypothetical protein
MTSGYAFPFEIPQIILPMVRNSPLGTCHFASHARTLASSDEMKSAFTKEAIKWLSTQIHENLSQTRILN